MKTQNKAQWLEYVRRVLRKNPEVPTEATNWHELISWWGIRECVRCGASGAGLEAKCPQAQQ